MKAIKAFSESITLSLCFENGESITPSLDKNPCKTKEETEEKSTSRPGM